MRLAAVIVLFLVVGFTTCGVGGIGSPRPAAAESSGAPSGSVSPHGESPDRSYTAVEPGRAPVVARSETRQASRAQSTALLTVALLIAAVGWRARRGRAALELRVRSLTEWWRPNPGGRAPPPALAS